jgi:hypothetical protein
MTASPVTTNVEESDPFSSVAELIDFSESLMMQTLSPDSVTWAFRGQARQFKTLVPSFQRQFTRQSVGAAEIIEARLLADFRSHYSSLTNRDPDMPLPEKIAGGFDLR